jgi:hypothetical protein
VRLYQGLGPTGDRGRTARRGDLERPVGCRCAGLPRVNGPATSDQPLFPLTSALARFRPSPTIKSCRPHGWKKASRGPTHIRTAQRTLKLTDTHDESKL